MKQTLLVLALIECVLLAAPAVARTDDAISSPRLEKFHLQDCMNGVCLSAVGQTGFVAFGHPALSASNVQVQIQSARTKTKSFNCDSFRYDVTTRLAVCDNRNAHNAAAGPSLTIDKNFLVTKY